MIHTSRSLCRGSFAFGLSLCAGVAIASHIDLFDAGPFSLTTSTSAASTTVSGIPVSSTLGGARFVGISGNTGTATASLGPILNPGANDDSLFFATTASASLTIGIGTGGPLNENFFNIPNSLAHWDRIRLDFGSGSAQSNAVTLQLFGSNGNTLSLTRTFLGGDANLDFLYGDFLGGAAFVQSTLQNINSVQLTLVGLPTGGTYAFESLLRAGSVLAVPEPAPLTLLALGFLGAALRSFDGVRCKARR